MSAYLKCCRVCLLQDESEVFCSIIDGSSEITEEIFNITKIKINEGKICKTCRAELEIAVKFRDKCIKSDSFLRGVQKCEENEVQRDEIEFIDQQEEDRIEAECIDQEISLNDQKTSSNNSNISTDGMARCRLCLKNFTSMHSLKDHMRAIHEELSEKEMFKCSHCPRLFKMKYYLNRHVKSLHSKEVNRKPSTRKRNKTKTKNDANQTEKQVGLNCPYCFKFLTSKHSLNDHISVKHEFINFSDRFLCDICGKNFPLKYYLIRHIRAAHLKTITYKKKENESLPCSICGKILKSKGNLSTHEKTHRILGPDEYWYCDICGNKFKGRGELTAHIKKRHLFKVQYPCEICPDKSWRTLFQLQRHMKVFHQNIREFKCEYCNKEFGEKNKLTCHLRIHTGEQPFECQHCGRKFTHQTDLRRHTWGHTGERPYKCEKESCGKGFMKKSELLAHETRCHTINQVQVRTVETMQIPFEYHLV